jgi:hypothetical protein
MIARTSHVEFERRVQTGILKRQANTAVKSLRTLRASAPARAFVALRST